MYLMIDETNEMVIYEMLDGQKFASDTEVQSVVRQWLGQQPASLFASGIQKLVDRRDKCLNELGRYVEK